jgi:hypothetical protein
MILITKKKKKKERRKKERKCKFNKLELKIFSSLQAKVKIKINIDDTVLFNISRHAKGYH